MPQDQLANHHHHTTPKMEACTTRRARLKVSPHELEVQQAMIHHAIFCQRFAYRAHALRARHLARALRHGRRRPRHRRPNSELRWTAQPVARARNESSSKLPKPLLVR